MRNTVPLSIAILAVAGAAPLAAQPVDRDVRCLMASNVFAQAEKDPQRRQVALASSFFFLGRLDARVPPAQIKAQLLAQGKTLNAKNVGQTMTECAKVVQAKQVMLMTIGKQIDQQAKPKPR
jgi:hypothetical protein